MIDDTKFIDYFKNNIPDTLDEFVDISYKNNLGGPRTHTWWKVDKLVIWETIYKRIKEKTKLISN